MGCFLLNLNKYVMSHDPVYLFEGNYWPRKKNIWYFWPMNCWFFMFDCGSRYLKGSKDLKGILWGMQVWLSMLSSCNMFQPWILSCQSIWTRSFKSKWFQMLEIWKCFSTKELHRATTQFQGIFRVQSTPGCSASWLHGNLKVTFQPERVALSILQVLCVDGHGFAW